MKPQTSWAGHNSPYTGKVPFKEVPIPKRPPNRKGATKYDEDFERLMALKTAIEVHEDGFQAVRRALKRFIAFRGITDKVVLRQQLDPNTRNVTVWLEKKE